MSVVCRYVSHLVPGGSDWSTWLRAARLHSSRAAGRAVGSSPLLSFLSRAHIHRNTHLLLSGPHFSLKKNTSERTTVESSDLPLKLCPTNKCQSHAGSVSQPRVPDSELGRFAPRNLRVKHSEPAPGTGLCRHVRSLKGREQIPQWGAATGGNILWALPPPALPFRLLMLCQHVATRRRQTHAVMIRTERRKPGFSVTSLWRPDSESSILTIIKASNVLAWKILSYMLITVFFGVKIHSDPKSKYLHKVIFYFILFV